MIMFYSEEAPSKSIQKYLLVLLRETEIALQKFALCYLRENIREVQNKESFSKRWTYFKRNMKDTCRNCSEMSIFLSRNSLIKLCFLRKAVLPVLLPTQKKRKWMERAVGMVRDCLTTKT